MSEGLEDGGEPVRQGIGRRRFMRVAAGSSLGLTGWLSQSCAGSRGGVADAPAGSAPTAASTPDNAPIFTPKVNGGINIQPVRRLDRDQNEKVPVIVPELVALQMRTVYELGFDGIRLTVPYGDRANFVGAIPYVRAARALGIDAVVVLSNFSGFVVARACSTSTRARGAEALRAAGHGAGSDRGRPNAGRAGAGGDRTDRLPGPERARPLLRHPARRVRARAAGSLPRDLHELNPQIIVVAAAEVGTLDGPPRMRAMFEAGLEDVCDRVAFHIYDPAVIPALSANVKGLVWVTESGAAGTDRHLSWVRDTDEEIRRRSSPTSRASSTSTSTTPTREKYRLIDIQLQGATYRAVAESADLYAYFAGNVAQAAAGKPLLPFEKLIPDIRTYFPTPEDVQAYDAVAR